MPLKIKGESINTVADAAAFFGVSTKTVNGWIKMGIISPSPTVEYGAGFVQIFPQDYLDKAKKELEAYRRKSKLKGNGTV